MLQFHENPQTDGVSEETTKWVNFIYQIGNSKFILRILSWKPQGSILWPLFLLLHSNDMPQAGDCKLLLYADDTCLIFQHKDITEIETALNKNFSMLCEWLIDINKYSFWWR